MHTTIELMDALRVRYGLTSDYQLAHFLGVERQAVSHYRTGRTLGDDTAIKVAELLGMDWAYVIACVHAERAQRDETKNLWAGLAKKLAPTALALLVGCTVIAAGPGAFDISPSFAQLPSQAQDFNIHYAQSRLALALLFITLLCAPFVRFRKTCSARSR